MKDKTYDELTRELQRLREQLNSKDRPWPPKKRPGLAAFKIEVLALALVLISIGALATFVLFSQKPTYVSSANILSACPVPSGSAGGSLILFSCTGTTAAFHVASAAAGTVTYSAFTVPSNITDEYLVDDRIGTATTCAGWTSSGNEPIKLSILGGTIPIGTIAGDLRQNHGYFYCMDFVSAPLSFNITVAWSQ